MDEGVEIEEYRRMAAVEDAMWYYRALHQHLERELTAGLGEGGRRWRRGTPSTGKTPAPPPRAENPPGQADRAMWQILDAGCGTGGLIRRLEPVHPEWRWTGVDVEPLACELARGRVARSEIVEASVTALPFGDASFDAVVSADVLYHLDDDALALREYARVLRPGGRIVINVPAHRWLWSYHDVAVHGRRRYVRKELRARLEAAGLQVNRLTHWNLLPLPLVIVRRKMLPAPRSGSDVRLYPQPVEAIFNGLMAVERGGLRTLRSFPVGTSILAVATKAD